MDIQRLVFARWKTAIEDKFDVPLYTSQAASNLSPPYAVALSVSRVAPIGRKAHMGEHDVRISVYCRSERDIERIFDACGINANSIVPAAFHCVEIGDSTTKATSRISDAGSTQPEADPPLGGGKCFSRVLTLSVRTGQTR